MRTLLFLLLPSFVGKVPCRLKYSPHALQQVLLSWPPLRHTVVDVTPQLTHDNAGESATATTFTCVSAHAHTHTHHGLASGRRQRTLALDLALAVHLAITGGSHSHTQAGNKYKSLFDATRARSLVNEVWYRGCTERSNASNDCRRRSAPDAKRRAAFQPLAAQPSPTAATAVDLQFGWIRGNSRAQTHK